MIYIVTFLLSLLFIKLSIVTKKKNKIISIILEIIAILLPCLLAALRDYSIGTDIRIYANNLFENSKKFSDFWLYYKSNYVVVDFLYLLVTFICGKLSSDIGLLFFVLEALVIIPIYIALKNRFGSSNSLILGMFLFFMFFYNQSYNLIRQGVSISFIILGLSFLEKQEKKPFWICLAIAYLFHSSALIFIIFYLLYLFINTKKINHKVKFIFEVMIVVGGIMAIPLLPKIVNIVGDLGIIRPEKELLYIKNVRLNYRFNYYYTLTYIFVFLVILIMNKRFKEKESNSTYYLFSAILSIILLQFDSVISNAGRIGYYMFYPLVITILPYIIYKEKMTKNLLILLLVVICFFAAYWFMTIVVANFNETYPYIFR